MKKFNVILIILLIATVVVVIVDCGNNQRAPQPTAPDAGSDAKPNDDWVYYILLMG